jgi:D-alanyl-D-alanine dipeptidase
MRCEALIPGSPQAADFRPLAGIAGLRVDLRYASPNNFVGRDLYGSLNCHWLHRDAAAGLARAIAWLKGRAPAGTTLVVLDALRPHRVQQELWDFLDGTDLRQYLADPARGSIHSYGMAVDVTLLDARGAELDMGTGFDDLTDLSHPKYEERFLADGSISQAQVANRTLLRNAMLQAGFHGISTEWWHFDFGDRDRVRANYTRID